MSEATENKKPAEKVRWWQQLDKLSPMQLGLVTALILLVTMALTAIPTNPKWNARFTP